MRALLALVCLCLPAAAAAGPTEEEAGWLEDLSDAVAADAADGKPLVVQVHVPLCDNDIIPCGNARLGDGDNPDTNLYWSTTPGFGEWFTRKKSGWKEVLDGDGDTAGDDDVLDVRVYRRKAGTLTVYVVAYAWRGEAIDRALDAYATDLYGTTPRTLTLDDGTELAAGGAARIVAYVGHNRLMDLDSYAWPESSSDFVKGTLAIACHTASYMATDVPSSSRVPLLMTRDFLFANAAPLEGAILAFATGGSYSKIRKAAAEKYADVQDRPVKKVQGAFTNPADKKWAP